MRTTDTPPVKARQRRFFYGYIVVAAGFGNMLLVHGSVNSFGVFFNPLLAEFSATRAILSFANSIAFLTMGILAILMGALSDRFGPRLILSVCALFLGAGYLLLSQTGAIWQVYLSFIVIGIGFSASDVVPLTTAARWFVKKRGIMSGIMKVGTGTGMMSMPLIASALIAAYDWRNSYIILGLVILVAVIPLSQLMRRDPEEMGLLPDNEPRGDTAAALPEAGLPPHSVMRTQQFWMVCGIYFAVMYIGSTVMTHIVPHGVDMGINPAVAAGVVSTIGASSIIGRLTMGFTGDKLGHKRGIIICLIVAITSLTWLQFADSLWKLYLFGAIYGFNHGGFFALISPFVAGLFGTRSQGTILGAIIFCGTIGSSISAVLSGYIFDITRSYHIAFLILLALAISGLALVSLVRPLVSQAPAESAS